MDSGTEASASPSAVRKPPLISVIVPVYNVREYLGQCLESLTRQTDPRFEVVLVDDGSTDGGSEIIAEYCKANCNFRTFRQENAGLGAARNAGLKAASGELITFVDSDDWVSDDYVETLRREQAREDFDVVSAGFHRVTETGVLFDEEPKRLRKHVLQSGVALSHAESVLGVFSNSVAWGRLYKKGLLESHKLQFPGRLPHEDWFFTYKALMLCRSESATPDVLYYYRQREGALSKSVTTSHADTLIEQWRDAQRFLANISGRSIHHALVARRTIIALKGMSTRLESAPQQTRDYFGRTIARHRDRLIDAAEVLWRSDIAEDRRPELMNILEQCERLQMSNLPNAVSSSMARSADRTANLERYPRNEKPHPLPDVDRQRLAAFHNAYEGERCFIIGNGPSLNKHDLSKLEDEYTFAVNSFFYKTDETGFRPTFFVVEDNLVMGENIERIKSYVVPFKFFPIDYESLHPRDENVFFFHANWGYYVPSSPNFCIPRFSTDATKELFCGQTVTYINMQLAYFMGFREVYLIGMDFDYIIPKEHGRKGNWIFSTTDDPNHFHKDYFGKGKTWKDPKLDRVAVSYKLAKLAYEATGRKLCNASIGGKLEIFERIDYASLFLDTARDAGRGKPVRLEIVPHDAYAAIGTSDSNSRLAKSEARTSNKIPDAQADGSTPAAQAPSPAVIRPVYAAFGDRLMRRSPKAFALLRFTRRTLAGLWRRRAWVAPTALLLAGFAALGFLPALAGYQVAIWVAAAFAAVLFTLFYVALRVFHVANVATTLSAETAALRKQAADVQREIKFAAERQAVHAASLERANSGLRHRLESLAANLAAREARLQAEIAKTAKAAEERDAALKAQTAVLSGRTVGLDVVSAMRALRPLWTGESATQILETEKGVEHGHALMMAALIELEQAQPKSLKGKTLIEIGTTRERDPAQGSTEKFAIFTALTGMRLVSVDMDPKNIDHAKRILRFLNPVALAVAEKGEDFLAAWSGPVDFVYLDAFDFEHGKHSSERRERYKDILKTDINDEACWRMHAQCAEILIERMAKGGLVVLDDTWTDAEGAYAGKGKLAVPLLLESGFEIVARTSRTIALKRTDAP